ncbi:hypothetical protein mRhiFer1_008964 [Rhinolophus ferrumequinum]|uniref:Uncharacterized protein n=1 Tax=Rhinolophus ferrumequinum TaxID=59479 RepID=A0A7J7TDS5_RHIFE|nr:hypothetical protein mRhiFer1_008964 [Rhinolophus ferrumequinum]
MSLTYWGSVLFYLRPLNESQGMGEEGELHLGDGVGRVGPTPKGRQTICFTLDVVLGVGRAQEGHSPLLIPFVLILEMRHKGSYVLFLRTPAKNPIPCSNAPYAVVSGMYFHLKTTLNGAPFFLF